MFDYHMVLAQFQQCGVKKTNLLTSILLGDDLFQRHAAKKKWAMWTSKWGLKSGPHFGGRERKNNSADPKRGPDFAPHFGVHIAHVFRSVTPEKKHVV